jgi:alpha-galactosidase
MLSRRNFALGLLAPPVDAPARVIGVDGAPLSNCRVERSWRNGVCQSTLINTGEEAVRVVRVELFEFKHGCAGAAALYGEGFQMLSQTGGTLAQPEPIGAYTDRKHYRIPEPDDAITVYNLLCLAPAADRHLLYGFSSSHRFVGRFHVRPATVTVALDCEGLELQPRASWRLEEFCRFEGPERAALLARLGERLTRNHPRLAWEKPPQGWCSWYCFGPQVTATQVMENLDWISKHAPQLRYVQIDDGYQPAMGDWLATGKAFGGDIRAVLKEIKKRGFEPALWVAPFIAEQNSQLFREHPEWFMRDADGKPLPSDRVSFGGWRHGPWYALDATQAPVQRHLENLFRTLNQEWGVTYFKLDANFWGALHGAKLADANATRVEAYRRGMRAILRGAGPAFILGCNHPVWPSMGVIHGSRGSGDISRNWKTISTVARENLHRNWQNGVLWWNDPDALVLAGALPENEFLFHAVATCATGGMLLSGDDLTKLPSARAALLKRLEPTAKAAAFDPQLRIGRARLADRELIFLLNWSERAEAFEFSVESPAPVEDYLTGKSLGRAAGRFVVDAVEPHSGRVLALRTGRAKKPKEKSEAGF